MEDQPGTPGAADKKSLKKFLSVLESMAEDKPQDTPKKQDTPKNKKKSSDTPSK